MKIRPTLNVRVWQEDGEYSEPFRMHIADVRRDGEYIDITVFQPEEGDGVDEYESDDDERLV